MSCHMMISHDEYRRVVYRPCSSCISNIQNPMETPLSSPCQLRLGVDLSHHSLRPYILYILRFWIKCSNAWETIPLLELS